MSDECIIPFLTYSWCLVDVGCFHLPRFASVGSEAVALERCHRRAPGGQSERLWSVLTVSTALVVLLVALRASTRAAFLPAPVPLPYVGCCPSRRPLWPCIKCSNSLPFFPLPDSGTGPRQAAGCVCVHPVPTALCSSPPSPGASPPPHLAPGHHPHPPPAPRWPGVLSPGLPELGIKLGNCALSGFCFCNLHLLSSCSPFLCRWFRV